MTVSMKIDKDHTFTMQNLHDFIKKDTEDPMGDLYISQSPLRMSSISSMDPQMSSDTMEATSEFEAQDSTYQTNAKIDDDVKLLPGLKSSGITEQIQAQLTAKFKHPYNTEFMDVLVDIGENDDVVDAAFSTISWAAVGQKKTIKVYPIGTKDYSDEEQVEKDLSKLGFKKQDVEDYIKFVVEVEKIIELDQFNEMAVHDAMQGGRTGMLMEYFKKKNKRGYPDGTPAMLKPLSFRLMGQNLNDKTSWRVRYVENLDVAVDHKDRWLDVKNMIYVAYNDSNRNPNRWSYGRSAAHALVKYSNILRQITERDIPEIVTSFWLKPGILETEEGMDPITKEKMIQDMYNGGLVVINEGSKFTPIDLKHDGWFLVKALEMVVDKILERLKVPRFFTNFQAASRSVVESAVNVFRDFTIAPIQRWYIGILKKQFYQRLLELFVSTHKDIPEDILYKVETEVIYDPFSIEDLLSKANSIELLLRRNVISIRESRKMMRLPEKRLEDSERDLVAKMILDPTTGLPVNPDAANADTGTPAPNGVPLPTLDKNVNQQGIKSPVTRINARPAAKKGAGRTRKV